MTLKLAVSTVAFRGMQIETIIALALKEKLTIEFSSGLPYREDMEQIYLEAPIIRLPHNYFPAPEKPFVLNLASLNDEIAEKSLNHCIRGLKLCVASGAPFFSVHAGFCIDPSPNELGREFKGLSSEGRNAYWSQFTSNIRKLVQEAQKLDVKLFIENNVCIKANIQPDGSSPLLCTDSQEIIKLINEIDNPTLGVLIDTGHLKVSAATFGFSKTEFIKSISSYIGAFHHSDNNAEVDSNFGLGDDYWFLPFMNDFIDRYHILEICDQSTDQIQRQFNLLRRSCNFGGGIKS